MQAQSTVTKCLAAILFTVGAAASFPLHSQGAADPPAHWVAPPPPFLLGIASGAQFGGQVSAANPTLLCFGRGSFGCGAHFDPRPIFAGALIGGLLGALSTPSYYPAPLGPHTGSLQHTSNPYPPDSSHGAWIADNWQHFGGPRPDSAQRSGAEGSQFVQKWQQFFEPAR